MQRECHQKQKSTDIWNSPCGPDLARRCGPLSLCNILTYYDYCVKTLVVSTMFTEHDNDKIMHQRALGPSTNSTTFATYCFSPSVLLQAAEYFGRVWTKIHWILPISNGWSWSGADNISTGLCFWMCSAIMWPEPTEAFSLCWIITCLLWKMNCSVRQNYQNWQNASRDFTAITLNRPVFFWRAGQNCCYCDWAAAGHMTKLNPQPGRNMNPLNPSLFLFI